MPNPSIKRVRRKVHSSGFSVYVLMTTKLRVLAKGEKAKVIFYL